MKRVGIIILAIALLLTAAACAAQPTAQPEAPPTAAPAAPTPGAEAPAAPEVDPDREILIGVSFGTLQEERWQRNLANMEARAAELGNVRIVAHSANGDENLQITQSENMVTQGVDVLMVIPINGYAAAPIIATAHAHDVPVVAYSRMIYDAPVDVYVSFDLRHVGVLQAQYAVAHAPQGNYFLIGGAPTDTNVPLIRDGQMSVLQPYIDRGDITVVVDQFANGWNPQEALIHVENGLVANNNDVVAVLTMNDGTAGGAVQALTEQGLAGEVVVTGLDADLSAGQRIMEGTQSMSVYRRFRVFDEMSIDLCVAVAMGVDINTLWEIEYRHNGYMYVPSIIERGELAMFTLDQNNMFEAFNDGWLAKEDVFRNIPEDEWPDWAR